MATIASDSDNPHFQGAYNPDSRLAVRFHVKAVPNEFETNAQGRPIFTDVEYVEIFVPGDNNTIIDQPVREDHKKRFPIQWAHFQNKHGKDTREVGTPLAEWPQVTASQVEELRAMKFYTVDSIANASDQNIQRIGMAAGMSPYAFREKAQQFLKVASGVSVAGEAEKRASEAEARNAELTRQLLENNAKLAALQDQMTQLLEPKQAKRGPKPKAVKE
jgi:hypothetical protein